MTSHGVPYILDTNVISMAIRGKDGTRQRLLSRTHAELRMASMVVAELEYGALCSLDPERHRRKCQELIGGLPVLPFDSTAGLVHARLRRQLRQHPIGERDLIIAAIALAHGCGVVTNNRGEYERVPGLWVEDWTG
ncbi:MAG: virulence-associated protein [Planctomycetota bacterium]|jgi:tRNA(fMet)-specific endonuclease VapC